MSRILPEIDEENAAFWTGGGDGKLHIQQCFSCGTFIHPPRGVCRSCLSDQTIDVPVPGTGKIDSFTVSYMAGHPAAKSPLVIARVALDHAPGVVLTTNIVGCDPDSVAVDMRVSATFEQHGQIFIPLFEIMHES